jgi:hypothetical protein
LNANRLDSHGIREGIVLGLASTAGHRDWIVASSKQELEQIR